VMHLDSSKWQSPPISNHLSVERVWVLPDCRIETTCCPTISSVISGNAGLSLSGNFARHKLYHCVHTSYGISRMLAISTLPDRLPDYPASFQAPAKGVHR